MSELSLGGKLWRTTDALNDIPSLIEQRLSLLRGEQSRRWDDPSVFPDIQKAVARVRSATQHGEKIAIFGDYDCDGITSAAQMVRCLRRWGSEPLVRLPHRVGDGYGLKIKHVDEFIAAGITLLITVDTGITAHDAVSHAQANGIDVIILDHHHWTTPPDAFAILHPGLAPQFSKPHPSAAGVVFLFVQAIEEGVYPDRDTDLALALFGTVADLVPLAGMNRRLVEEGLSALTRLPEGPLKQFVEIVSTGKRLTSVDVAFRIAPRINAAGRMADPTLALKALLEGGEELAQLTDLNVLRQEETARCIDAAMMMLTESGAKPLTELPAFLAVADASFMPGIVGLISGKLTERFGRPSMAVHINGDECTASLRSTGHYNIVESLARVSHLLISFGGHAQAAGCTFALQNFSELSRLINEDILSRVDASSLRPAVIIDAALDVREVTNNAVSSLDVLQPYGQGNTEPTFLIRNVLLEKIRRVGGEGRHLQAMAAHCKVIGFGMGEWDAHAKDPLDLVCKLGIDTWNGRAVPQLFVQDMKIAKAAGVLMKD